MKKMTLITFFTIVLPIYANSLVVDSANSKNLSLDKAANGVPLVNIEKPNNDGLSHNIFKEYNVGKEGIILNNATYFETTKLGGIVYGNPNLQAEQKQASTILTEVSGVNRSKLEGFTEIAGKQADYILANPNGIYVDGAGFINTGNVTLSTGKADKLLSPEKGEIEVAGKGLDLKNIDKSELIARTAKISAPVYGGNEVNIKLGSENQSNKAEYALDARALGSIYAGRINIISTEEGVGVKSAGLVFAEKGKLVIDSKGKVYLNNAQAKENINIKSKETEIQEKLVSEKGIDITGNTKNLGEIRSNEELNIKGNLENKESILTNRNLIVNGDLENNSTIKAKLDIKINGREFDNTGLITANNDININSKNITNTEKIIAKNILDIENENLKNNGLIFSENKMKIKNNKLENVGELLSNHNIELNSKNITTNKIEAKEELKIKADNIINTGKVYSTKNTKISAKNLKNKGDIISADKMHIDAISIDGNNILAKDRIIINSENLKNNKKIYSEGNISITSNNVENRGDILAIKNIKIENENLMNDGLIQSDESIDIKTKNLKNNKVLAKNLNIVANKLENKEIITKENLNIETKELINKNFIKTLENANLKAEKIKNYGNIIVLKNLSIENRELENSGKIYSEIGTKIRNEKLVNLGELLGEGSITIETKELENKRMITKGELSINSHRVKNTGKIHSGKDMKIDSKSIENSNEISSNGKVEIETVDINSSKILAKDSITIKSKNLKTEEKIYSDKNINITSNNIENIGDILAQKNINIKSKKLKNTANIIAKNNALIDSNFLDNDASTGTIYSDNTLKINSDKINLTKNIAAKNLLNLDTKKLNMNDSYVSDSDIAVNIDGDYINNYEFIGKNLKLTANNIVNDSILASKENLEIIGKIGILNEKNSLIYSSNFLDLSGGRLRNKGDILSKNNLNLKFEKNVENLTANIESKENIYIKASNFINKGSVTGSYTKKWVSGANSNINVVALPKEFLKEIDQLLERNRRSRKKFRGWDEDKRLIRAEQGISNYISHKSYLQAGGNIELDIKKDILNKEADILSNKNIQIKADNLINTREGKDIPIMLQFARRYHYRHKRGNGSNTTKHGDIYATKYWKDTLYSDKATQIIAGGDISIDAIRVGNGEEHRNIIPTYTNIIDTPTITGNINTNYNISSHNIDGTFSINNSMLINKIHKDSSIDITSYIDIPENDNGIFRLSAKKENPKFSYLIETNPKLINKEFYLGSDYFLSRINFNPDRDIRLLGDSFYEHKLITKAVLNGTGKKYLYSNNANKERKALFDNAIEAQRDLNLSLGITLTKEQVNKLKKDIIWYVEEEVAGEKVLVPKIFLSKNTLKNINENQGSMIKAGGNFTLNAELIDNSGKIVVDNNVNIRAKNILQNAAYSDTGIYGENIAMIADNNIENVGGNIKAQENILLFSKDGDIKNSKKLSIHQNNLRDIFTDVRANGEIVGNKVGIVANNIENLGADIKADSKIEIAARENLTIGNLETLDQKISISKKHFERNKKTDNIASNLKAKDIELNSLKNIEIIGTNIEAENKININAKDNISIVAGKNSILREESHSKSKSFGRSSSSRDILYKEENVGSELKAEDINIVSHKNINIVGSNAIARNDLNMLAAEDLNIVASQKAAAEIHEKTKSGFMKLSGKAKMEDNLKYTNVESKIGADKNINLNSGKNINIVASDLKAGEDINISAKENVNILAADDKFKSEKKESKYSVKPFASVKGLKFEAGLKANHSQNKENNFSTKVKESQISAGNDVNIKSNKDTNIQASTIISENTNIDTKGNLNLLTKDEININNMSGTEIEAKLSAKLDLSGIKETVKSVVDVVKGIPDIPKAVNAAADLASGKDINESLAGNEEGIEQASRMLNGPSSGGVSAGMYASASLEKTKSKTEIKNSVGSNIVSKEKISLNSDENIKMKQANIQGKNISINSKKDILIESELSAMNSKASSQSLNGELNLLTGEFNVGGGITKDKAKEESHINSQIYGENIAIRTEDLTIKGGNIEADKIDIQAKNLHIESMQDKADSQHQGINISVGTSSVGGGIEYGKHEKEWVNKQSTIIGREKSEIDVAEKTNIVGAVIGGKDTTLRTKELEYSNIEDKEKGFNVGISANTNIGSTNIYNEADPNNPHKQLNISKSGKANYDAVDREQINRATIGAGKIIVDGKETNPNINRDEKKAQEITKDISVKTIDVAYTDNARKWSEVATIMGEHGASLGKDLDTMTDKLADKNYELENKLGSQFYKVAKTTEEVIDNKFGNKFIGIIPTEDTNGGIAGELQSPKSLLNWNLKPIAITYSGTVDENGEFKIVSEIENLTKEKYEEFKEKNSEEIPYINGVGNTIKDHADGRFIGTLTPEEHDRIRKGEKIQKISIFNPTNGLIADGLEALIGQIGLIFGGNWNGKQMHKIEKEYKGIFDNGMLAHSQGTIIYTSKLRDDLETKEGREKISKMRENYMLGIAVVPWILDDTIDRMNALNKDKVIIEKRRNKKDFISLGTLNFKSNTTGEKHGVIGYNPYYFIWDNKIQKYRLKPEETGKLPIIKENKVINRAGAYQ